MTAATPGCWRCGEPNPDLDAPQAIVGGIARSVCCNGCRAAAQWIDHLGLADYYRLRSAPAPRVSDRIEGATDASSWAHLQLARHVVRELGPSRREVMMLIEGLRCAACVWLIERALATLPGIVSAQVNAVASRARIVWDDAQCTLPEILALLARFGYRASPLNAAAFDDARLRESRIAHRASR
jgi:P-type Cu2+ transporter